MGVKRTKTLPGSSPVTRSAWTSPTFFATPAEFRSWLELHHETATELWVGFHKKNSTRPSITWPQSVDEALCVGWIDGLRKNLDETSYVIRFTPRKPRSIWSAINIDRVADLMGQDRMRAAGLSAFARRTEAKSRIYAYEQRGSAQLDAAAERKFRVRPKAWEFFQTQPASYRKLMIHRITGAKKAETRARRLDNLIEASARATRL